MAQVLSLEDDPERPDMVRVTVACPDVTQAIVTVPRSMLADPAYESMLDAVIANQSNPEGATRRKGVRVDAR